MLSGWRERKCHEASYLTLTNSSTLIHSLDVTYIDTSAHFTCCKKLTWWQRNLQEKSGAEMWLCTFTQAEHMWILESHLFCLLFYLSPFWSSSFLFHINSLFAFSCPFNSLFSHYTTHCITFLSFVRWHKRQTAALISTHFALWKSSSGGVIFQVVLKPLCQGWYKLPR